MNLEIVSYGGSNLNNANYVARLLGEDGDQADGDAVLVRRANAAPVFVYKNRKERLLPFSIELKGTVTTQIDTIKSIFDTYDSELKRLIVKDIGNSDKQWYVDAVPIKQGIKGRNVDVVLSVPDPIWKSVATSTVTWTATSTPHDALITVAGNREAFPVITLRGTVSKGAVDFQHIRFVHVYSRATIGDGSLPNYPLNLTNGLWGTSAIIADNASLVLAGEANGLNASQTSFQVTSSGGALPTFGMAYIDTEQITFTSYITNPTACITGAVRGVNGTTGATHTCGTGLRGSQAQADGDDIRVFVDDIEVPRWFQGMNGSATGV